MQASPSPSAGAGGNRQAFADLFDRYAPRLHGRYLQLGLDPPAAAELTQEVMTVAWHEMDRLEGANVSPAAWLLAIARRRRAGRLRRSGTATESGEVTGLEAALPEVPAPARATEDRVREALATLTPEARELIRLRLFKECSDATIAARLGAPVETVTTQMRSAVAALRAALAAD